jgi:hypothetical protein
MILFLDHVICNEGQGYTNYSGKFYSTSNLFNNLYTYSLPFKQVISDSSVSGASILSGVYLNGSFIKNGQSNLISINHHNGQAFFNTGINVSQLSGYYAVKDFNIYLTNKAEEEVLFETQYYVRPKITQNITGLAPNTLTAPAIFIKSNKSVNEPFAFGGVVDAKIEIRAIVLADSLFNLDAVCGLLRDTAHRRIPLIRNNDLGMNYLGCVNSGFYNYANLRDIKINEADSFYIEEVLISKNFNFMDKINQAIFPAFVDFTLSKIRKL